MVWSILHYITAAQAGPSLSSRLQGVAFAVELSWDAAKGGNGTEVLESLRRKEHEYLRLRLGGESGAWLKF